MSKPKARSLTYTFCVSIMQTNVYFQVEYSEFDDLRLCLSHHRDQKRSALPTCHIRLFYFLSPGSAHDVHNAVGLGYDLGTTHLAFVDEPPIQYYRRHRRDCSTRLSLESFICLI